MATVKDLLIILIGSSLVSNVVLSQFLGLCPFLGVSKKTETAAGHRPDYLRLSQAERERLEREQSGRL